MTSHVAFPLKLSKKKWPSYKEKDECFQAQFIAKQNDSMLLLPAGEDCA